MKWRNGKYERVIETHDFRDNLVGDGCCVLFEAEIYARNEFGRFELVDGCVFYSWSEAVAWAAMHRLARLYPGRLLRVGDIYVL